MHRSASRMGAVQEKKKVTLSEVEQGLKVLYPLDKIGQSSSTDFELSPDQEPVAQFEQDLTEC